MAAPFHAINRTHKTIQRRITTL